MTNSNLGTALRCVLVVATLGTLSGTVEDTNAQSNIVFMTADDESLDSHLHRFDAGVESFAVNTGAADAFLGVTSLNGEVLVANYVGNQIERFSPNGTYLGPFTFTGFGPTYLESDSGGNVYVTPVPLLDPPIAWRFDSSGNSPQFFSHPSFQRLDGIDADAIGNVYIVSNETNPTPDRLFKFAPNGTFLTSISLGITNANDLAIDEAGNRLFVADEFGAGLGIKVFDISGAIPIPIGSVVTPVSANMVGLHYASESGNILATDYGLGSGDPRGLEFSPTGVLLRAYRPANVQQAWDIVTMVPEPNSMLLVLAGAIGFAIPGGKIRRR